MASSSVVLTQRGIRILGPTAPCHQVPTPIPPVTVFELNKMRTHGSMWLLPIPFPIYVARVHVDHMHGMQGHFRICQCASAIVPGVTSAEVSPWPWWNITKERKSFAKLCWSEPSRTTTTMNARTTGSVERTGRTIPSSRSRSGANYGRSAFAVIRVNRIYCSI